MYILITSKLIREIAFDSFGATCVAAPRHAARLGQNNHCKVNYCRLIYKISV